jgi:hypothetical protein
VDVLFRHVGHYFDRVLLPDGVGDLLLQPPDGWNQESVLEKLLNRIDLVLHIQQLGAIDLVYYYPRTPQSAENFAEILDPEQEAQWAEAWRGVEATLTSEGRYHFERLGPRRFRVDWSDPLLGVGSGFEFKLDKGERASKESLRAKVAHSILHRHISHLEEDLQARRMMGAPLGTAVWSHGKVLSRIGGVPGAEEILFRLSLPSRAHVPIRELIAVRATEGASFETFRSVLTKAAREMARKVAVSVVLAGLTTTCGLLLGVPLVAGVGTLTSGAGMGTAAFKYLDEKQSIELSDMYFLWKALGHAG